MFKINKASVYMTEKIANYLNQIVDPHQKEREYATFNLHYINMGDAYMKWQLDLGPQKSFKKAIDVIDEYHKEVLSRAEGLSCKKGCSHCCHLSVDSQDIEVLNILDFCKENNIDIDKTYLQEQATNVKDRKQFNHPTHSACVFLKNNLCSIYEVRPVSCRNYLVFTDPEKCNMIKYPGFQTHQLFYWPVETLICVISDKEDSKRGDFVELLLKHI